ncbi:GNAT family N-acetyltransferase [Aciditerrimonas ferrireducens]|uniref:GNAT family N-acetyltransferase n=1 Tax=Aciditerrimonas ferrireducens TaxID=667306 RepID=A0ABV6C5P6_9ACTN|nr:GNAT family N-acetyltransferase [Aciditerrimonas ferrireducens]MCK4176637.1 GNAT family N-acetyltransferase [Aciditerrimonas ferrireducens]
MSDPGPLRDEADRPAAPTGPGSGRTTTVEGARAARRTDADRCAELARAALEAAQAQRGGALLVRREAYPAGPALLRPGGLDRLLGDRRRRVVVGTLDEVVVGVLVARVDDVQGALLGVLELLYVEPAARGVGVGGAMLQLAVDALRQAGCLGIDAVALPGDLPTKRLLESSGFVARAITMHLAEPTTDR